MLVNNLFETGSLNNIYSLFHVVLKGIYDSDIDFRSDVLLCWTKMYDLHSFVAFLTTSIWRSSAVYLAVKVLKSSKIKFQTEKGGNFLKF